MLALIAQLLPLVEQITEYEKVMEDGFLSHADREIFESLPRAGKRLAPRMPGRNRDDRKRFASLGWNTRLFSSRVGPPAGFTDDRPVSNPCATPCIGWRGPSTLSETWVLEYAQRKRKESKSQSVAVRALAHVWARVMSAMWQTSQCSQAATFEEARQRHLQRVASKGLPSLPG